MDEQGASSQWRGERGERVTGLLAHETRASYRSLNENRACGLSVAFVQLRTISYSSLDHSKMYGPKPL